MTVVGRGLEVGVVSVLPCSAQPNEAAPPFPRLQTEVRNTLLAGLSCHPLSWSACLYRGLCTGDMWSSERVHTVFAFTDLSHY